jgi:hypothetical protein
LSLLLTDSRVGRVGDMKVIGFNWHRITYESWLKAYAAAERWPIGFCSVDSFSFSSEFRLDPGTDLEGILLLAP